VYDTRHTQPVLNGTARTAGIRYGGELVNQPDKTSKPLTKEKGAAFLVVALTLP
jgi:hypothetical protein